MSVRKIYINKYHIIIEIISYVIMIGCFGGAIYNISISPEEVPIHYNLQGEIDGYGSPYTYLVLPLIMFFTNVMLSLLFHLLDAKYWNMPFTINPGKEIIVYRDMCYVFVVMELVFSIFTAVSVISEIFIEHNGNFMLIASLVMTMLLFILILIPAVIAYKHNKI